MQPLSDVFSSQPISTQSPIRHNNTRPPPPRFEIATDVPQKKAEERSQTDSGYHGSSQVQMDTEYHIPSPPPRSPLYQNIVIEQHQERERTTEGSFHSAKEDQTTKLLRQPQPGEPSPRKIDEPFQPPVTMSQQSEQTEDFDVQMDDIGSPSDESTPDRPLVRKGSLTFASLPSRDPMKTSIGARISRTSHIDQKKSLGPSRNSQSLHHGPISVPTATEDEPEEEDEDENETMDDSHIEILGQDSEDESQTVRQHTKSSTQRLHDKIEMLGKAPVPRPSKSITSATQLANRQSGAPRPSEKAPTHPVTDDDDDWIKPLASPRAKQPPSPDASRDEDEEYDLRAPELIAHEERMRTPAGSPSPGKQRPGFGHAKSASTATLASPAKIAMDAPASPAKSISASYTGRPTTTPQGSPRKYLDMSASKSKLQSIMKTAKGLFTSSAGVSAAAKLETLSPNALRMASNTMPGMFPSIDKLIEDKSPPTSPWEGRKTRSSSEREKAEKRNDKDVKSIQKMDDQLKKAREHEAQKAKQQQANSPRRERELEHEDASQPSKVSRLGKPTREPAPKGKPAPVNIRVGTHSHRMPMGSSIMNSNQETLPAEPKRPGLTKKASNASIQSITSNSFKTSVQPTKPRALLAAERKKEQDEREAQRKLEQKREVERKRAAQQEEVRKQEAKQRVEAERKERERLAVEQAKRQAQQQAIERKRQENARRIEQQRLERTAAETAPARPPSRLGNQPVGRSLINHPLPTNPAKPAKRPVEEDNGRPQAAKFGAASQQQDAKRRRTDEEAAEPVRPTMSGAPIRQSNLGKKVSIFNHPGYAAAPPPAHVNQFPQPPSRAQPPQMAQYANNKIPFADAPNPPAPAKTPLSAYQHKTIQAVKSSPQYQNGEQIHLPEIPTDSEDEDSEDEGNAFPIPDWATPGHLTNQLIAQEAMDGDAVFGPIAPLKMEEIFAKGNKERLKRLKDRTSSANWIKSGDALTLEEVRIDREQRERMRLEGGWRFGS